jgi:hypothetical protein
VEFQKGLTSFNYQEIDSACSERQAQRSSTSCWSMASMVPRVTQKGKRRMRQAHVVAAVEGCAASRNTMLTRWWKSQQDDRFQTLSRSSTLPLQGCAPSLRLSHGSVAPVLGFEG